MIFFDPFEFLDKETLLNELNLSQEQEEVLKKHLPDLFEKPKPIVPVAPSAPAVSLAPIAHRRPPRYTYRNMPITEDYNKPNPERELRKKKQAKQRELMRAAGNAYIDESFKNVDFEYKVNHNKKATIISVQIKDNKWAEFRLTHTDGAKFMQELMTIPDKVANLKALFENMSGDVTIVKNNS